MIRIGSESTPMKALACVAGLFAVLFAIWLGLLAAGRTPDDARVVVQWANVERLQLPETTLAEITEMLGPCESSANDTYRWFTFNDSFGCHWSMLWITVDAKTGMTIAYERLQPLMRGDGTVEKVIFDAGWRDEQGYWHSGPMPSNFQDSIWN
jgi:hypothetical protein